MKIKLKLKFNFDINVGQYISKLESILHVPSEGVRAGDRSWEPTIINSNGEEEEEEEEELSRNTIESKVHNQGMISNEVRNEVNKEEQNKVQEVQEEVEKEVEEEEEEDGLKAYRHPFRIMIEEEEDFPDLFSRDPGPFPRNLFNRGFFVNIW